MLRQTLLYLPAQLLGPLAMFVAAVVWTHLLDAPTYGVVSYVLALQELIHGLTLGWWSFHALRYRGTAEAERKVRLVRADAAVVFAAAALQAAITWPLLAALGLEPSPALAAISAVLFATRSMLGHYSEIARAEETIGTYTVAQLAGPLAGTLASFAGVALVGSSPAAALAGIAAAQVAGLAWTLARLGVRPAPGMPDRDLVAEAFAYGGPIILAGLFGWISTNAIRQLVDFFAGAEALGLVSVGWGLGLRVSSVAAMSLTAAAFPIAVKLWESGDEAGALEQLAINGSMLFALLAPVAVGVALVAEPLTEAMIAAPYRTATIAVLPLSVLVGVVRNQRTHHFDQVFLLAGGTRKLVGLNLLEAVATTLGTGAGLLLGRGPIGALVGATAGGLVGTTIAAVATAIAAIRIHHLRPQWGTWGRILVACAAMAAAVTAVTWGRGPAALTAEIATGAVVYAIALAALFPTITRMSTARIAARLVRARRS